MPRNKDRWTRDGPYTAETVHEANAVGACARCGTSLGFVYGKGAFVVIADAAFPRGSWTTQDRIPNCQPEPTQARTA